MSITELFAIIGLVGYAVYKQTRIAEVKARGRFRLAFVYLIVGAILGIEWPHSWPVAGLVSASFALSLIVGLARGACTRVWREPNGRVRSRGTKVTIVLFVALIASKFVLGAVAESHGLHDTSTGEVLVMIAVSVAVQAEVVWRRAQALRMHGQPGAAVRPVLSI